MTRTELAALLLANLYLDYVEETGDKRPDVYVFRYSDFEYFTGSLGENDRVKITVEIVRENT